MREILNNKILVQSQPRHPSTTITVLSLTFEANVVEKRKKEYNGIGPWISLYVFFPDATKPCVTVITFGQLKAVAKYSELASVPSTLNLREKRKT